MIPHTHSQAHLQFTRASTQPKITKELVCLPSLFCPTLKTNFFGNGSASIELIFDYKIMIMN
jgi:hypothetical protein